MAERRAAAAWVAIGFGGPEDHWEWTCAELQAYAARARTTENSLTRSCRSARRLGDMPEL